ncbi:hypothetical protein ACK36C_02675 [Aeromonas veronii]
MSAAISFKKYFSKNSLRKIYTDKIKNSGAIGLDRTRPANLNNQLDEELEHIVQKKNKERIILRHTRKSLF